MKKVLLFLSIFFINLISAQETLAADLSARLSGRILLQVESRGEAWYVDPVLGMRIYLGRPQDAFNVMRERGLGVSEDKFLSWGSRAPKKFAGRILLRVESEGEAYYVNPADREMHYLGRPRDAFLIMKNLGLGVADADLRQIAIYGLADVNSVIIGVPFTSQAPFAEWGDDRFQDGCEEASSLMAVKWARGEGLSLEEARDEMVNLAAFELKNYGGYRDTSVHDTAERIINGYFQYGSTTEVYDFKLDDLKDELAAGNVIIVPADGQRLKNPNFTPPGPERHMLLLIGYDEKTGEFVTNDPGTRKGRGYRYKEQVLFGAIREYPTGNHEPIAGERKAMIVVSR